MVLSGFNQIPALPVEKPDTLIDSVGDLKTGLDRAESLNQPPGSPGNTRWVTSPASWTWRPVNPEDWSALRPSGGNAGCPPGRCNLHDEILEDTLIAFRLNPRRSEDVQVLPWTTYLEELPEIP